VRREDMPSRSWSLNQNGNSLMSIVIGPRNDGAYPISKTAPKSKRLRASSCSLHCGHVAAAARFKGDQVSGAARVRGFISHIYPMFEPGHQTPYHRFVRSV
jgi:hypothetical protein